MNNPPIYKCFVCEKDLESVSEDAIGQVHGGGEVRLSFDYGSRKWDCIAFRESVHEEGFLEHVQAVLQGQPSDFQSKTGPIGSRPRDQDQVASRASKLASCTHIIGVICDECFEAKSHLLRGFEKDQTERKPKLVVE